MRPQPRFAPHEQSCFNLLEAMASAGVLPRIRARPAACPWADLPDSCVIAFDLGGEPMPARAVAWLASHGFGCCAGEALAYAFPLVEAALPAVCYHATPAENLPGIIGRGLLTGLAAGRSTTGRVDAASRIHVSFTPEHARAWATRPGLLSDRAGVREWVVLAVERAGIAGRVFRDHRSETGYILEAACVPPEFIRVQERVVSSPARIAA